MTAPSLALHFRRGAAWLLGVILPLAMLLATKSSPLVVTLAALLMVASVSLAGQGPQTWARMRQGAIQPASLVVAAFLVWAVVSLGFHHAPASGLRQVLEMMPPLLAGLLLLVLYPVKPSRKTAVLFMGAAVAAALIMAVDLQTGLMLRRLTGGRAMDYSYNRAAVTLVMLMLPLAALALAAGQRWLVAGLVVIALSAELSASGTASLALLVMIAVFPVAWFFPQAAIVAGGGGLLLLIAAMPWFASLVSLVLGRGFHEAFRSAHTGDRVDIWLSFQAALRESWLTGQGFGASLTMSSAPVATLVPPERAALLGASHPHNAFLQLWVELGAVGALLLCILIVLFCLWVWRRVEPWLRPFWITWLAVTAAVALVSHGAWQPWWIAAVAVSGAGLAAVRRV